MSLKRGENKKAIDKAIGFCDSSHSGLFEWQDCVQGVNIMRRVVRQGASVSAAEKSAIKVCASKNKFPGPRARCQQAVRVLARAARRK